MSQHDYVVADDLKATVHTDINNALLAIVSNNSGSSAPGTTYAYQFWLDTNAGGTLKIRNAANSAWVTIGTLTTNLGLLTLSGGTLTGALLAAVGSIGAPGIAFDGDSDSGLYRVGSNSWGLVANGVEYCRISTDGITFLGTGATQLPSGTTAQRPGSPVNGMIRYNSDLTAMDVYVGGAWKTLSTAENYPFTTDDFEDVVTSSGTSVVRSDFGGVSSANQIKQCYEWSNPTLLADAATMPSGACYGGSISANGEFFSLISNATPFLHIYQRNGVELVKLANPSTIPSGASSVKKTAFSMSSEYLAVAEVGSPYILIYKRNGSTFTKLANPASLPSDSAAACKFSHNSEFLAIGITGFSSTNLNLYQRSGDTFTKLTNPTAPAGEVVDCDWSSDSRFLAVVSATSPYLNIYRRSAGTTFTLLSSPSTTPTGSSKACRFSPNGNFLAVAHISSPYITIYERSGSTFSKISNPSDLPTSDAYGCAWSADSRYLAVGVSSTPYIVVYEVSGTTFTKLSDPSSLPSGKVTSCEWSSDNQFLLLTNEGGDRFNVYQTGSAMPTSSILTIKKRFRSNT